MKKTLLVLLSLSASFLALSQTTDTKQKIDLSNRAADHFMIQYGADSWTNRPDSVRTAGFSRHFNIYFMLDKPFKTNPKYSIAYGIGIEFSISVESTTSLTH